MSGRKRAARARTSPLYSIDAICAGSVSCSDSTPPRVMPTKNITASNIAIAPSFRGALSPRNCLSKSSWSCRSIFASPSGNTLLFKIKHLRIEPPPPIGRSPKKVELSRFPALKCVPQRETGMNSQRLSMSYLLARNDPRRGRFGRSTFQFERKGASASLDGQLWEGGETGVPF
jgi:hypothetical protein